MKNKTARREIESLDYYLQNHCEELECGKVWDGHTEEDVTRLLSLGQQPSFINKPCVSEGVCREDKLQVLDKILLGISATTV